MPQQFHTVNYSAAVAPIAETIRNLPGNFAAAKNLERENALRESAMAQMKTNKEYNTQAYEGARNYFGKIDQLKPLTEELPPPQQGESPQVYQDRLAKGLVPIFQHLNDLGLDPNDLKTAAIHDGVDSGTITKMIQDRTGLKVQQALTAGPENLSRTMDVGASKAEQDYLAETIGTGRVSFADDKAAHLRAKAPMPFPDMPSLSDGAYSPVGVDYKEGKSIVDENTPNMNETDLKRSNTTLNDMATREVSTIAQQPGQTRGNFYADVVGQGLPINEDIKTIGGAVPTALDLLKANNKKDPNEITESTQLSRLKYLDGQRSQANQKLAKAETTLSKLTGLRAKVNKGTTELKDDEELRRLGIDISQPSDIQIGRLRDIEDQQNDIIELARRENALYSKANKLLQQDKSKSISDILRSAGMEVDKEEEQNASEALVKVNGYLKSYNDVSDSKKLTEAENYLNSINASTKVKKLVLTALDSGRPISSLISTLPSSTQGSAVNPSGQGDPDILNELQKPENSALYARYQSSDPATQARMREKVRGLISGTSN